MQKIEHPEVQRKFLSYPNHIREKLLLLWQTILDTAANTGTCQRH